jgi:hypothetical protein
MTGLYLTFFFAGIFLDMTYLVHNWIPGIVKVCFLIDFIKDFLSLSCFVFELQSLSSSKLEFENFSHGRGEVQHIRRHY